MDMLLISYTKDRQVLVSKNTFLREKKYGFQRNNNLHDFSNGYLIS